MEKAFPKVGILHTCRVANSSQNAVYFMGRGNCISPEWELPLLQPGRCQQQGEVGNPPGMYLHSAQTKPQCRQWLQTPRGLYPWGLLLPQDQDPPPVCAGAQIFPSWAQGVSQPQSHSLFQQNRVVFTSNSCFQLTKTFDDNCRSKCLKVKVQFVNVWYLELWKKIMNCRIHLKWSTCITGEELPHEKLGHTDPCKQIR